MTGILIGNIRFHSFGSSDITSAFAAPHLRTFPGFAIS
jgi:hypothetical protein